VCNAIKVKKAECQEAEEKNQEVDLRVEVTHIEMSE